MSGTMTPREVQLATALRRARDAAEAAKGTDDGGSANFDAVVLLAKRGLTGKTVTAAAEAAGISVRRRQGGYWSGWFLGIGQGQGAMNTRMVEAAERELTAAGEYATVYYRVD